MGIPGPLVGRAGGVPRNHLTGSPACQPHQIALVATGSEELMSEGMSELMWMEHPYPRLSAPPSKNLGDPRRCEPAPGAKPQPGEISIPVPVS